MHNTACPTVAELRAYNAGVVSLEQLEEIARHLSECTACLGRLAKLDEPADPMLRRLKRLPASSSSAESAAYAGLAARILRSRNPQAARSTSHRQDTADDAVELEIPDRLDVYEVIEEIGRGGMGAVYKARDLRLKRLVALKVILSDHPNLSRLARFRTEAESAARLNHPGIVPIYDMGEADGRPYLVLELLEGGSLSQFVDENPQPPRQAARIVATLSRAVHYAHLYGVVHRDLKPSNVLISAAGDEISLATNGGADASRLQETGSDAKSLNQDDPIPIVKITDFGLAKQLDTDHDQTHSGAILGTPQYMAPEQAAGEIKQVGPAADIYALGAILYALLSGRPPFRGQNAMETLLMVQQDEPVPPRRLQPNLSRDLETICLKSLEKDPAQRYESAQALAEDLDRFLAQQPILARPVSLAGRLVKWSKRRPVVARLAAALVVVAIGGFGLAGWNWRDAVLQRDRAVRSEQIALERAQAERRAKLAAQNAEQSEREARRAEHTERKKTQAALDRAETNHYQGNIAQTKLYYQLNDVTTARAKLEDCLPDRGVDRRGWEWWYLNGLLNRELFTVRADFGPASCVYALEFSDDGRLLATGTGPGSYMGTRPGTAGGLRVWDAATGQLTADLSGKVLTVRDIAFSPDSKHIIAAELNFYGSGDPFIDSGWEAPLRIWDLATGDPVLSLGEKAKYDEVVFRPEGGQVAATRTARRWPHHHPIALVPREQDEVVVWDARSGARLSSFPGHWSPSFSQDGERLHATRFEKANTKTEYGQDTVLDLTTGARLGAGPVMPVGRISPNRTRVAFSERQRDSIRIWNVSEEKIGPLLMGHEGPINCFAFSPQGEYLATGGSDATVRVWEVNSGREAVRLLGHETFVLSVAFSPLGDRLASGDASGAVKVWDLTRKSEQITGPAVRVGVARPLLEGIAFHRDTVVALDQRHQLLNVWDAGSGVLLRRHRVAVNQKWQNPSRTIAFTQDGSRVAGTAQDDATNVEIWDTHRGKWLVAFRKHKSQVLHLRFAPDGSRVASASAHTVRIWQADSGRELLAVPRPDHAITGIAVSPGGKQLAVGVLNRAGKNRALPQTRLEIWDLEQDAVLHRLGVHRAPVSAMEFSPHGERLASIGQDGRLVIWDARTGEPMATISGPGGVGDLTFSPNGRRLAGATLSQVTLWDAFTGQEILALKSRPPKNVPPFNPRVRFSPDGSRIAASQWNGEIRIWSGGATRLGERQRQAEQRTEQWLYDRSQHALGAGRWDAAIGYLNRLIDVSPRRWRYYADRAFVYARLSELNRRDADFSQALRLAGDGKNPLIQLSRGEHVEAGRIPFDEFDGFTIEAWVAEWFGAVAYQGESGESRQVSMNLGSRGISGMKFATPSVGWHHVALVRDGAQMRIFLDGEPIRVFQVSQRRGGRKTHKMPLEQPFYIGKHDDACGAMRSLRVSSTARYTRKFVPANEWTADTHTELLFDFSRMEGSHVPDLSGKARHGTVRNAWWLDPIDE